MEPARHPSPPLVLLAVVHAVLLLASLPFPSRWRGFLQLGAAIPLGLFAATASSRLHFLGVRAAGATIALFGGVGAALLLAVSGATQWTLGMFDALEWPPVARAIELLAFATGGPAHMMLLGLLLAGLSVTSAASRLLPVWLTTAGLVLAALAELSWLSLVVSPAEVLLPIVRFPALAWLIAAGALLPRARELVGGRARSITSTATLGDTATQEP
jgi:hypothetical protein